MSQLFVKHEEKLTDALEALSVRGFYCAYAEDDKAYDPSLAMAAQADFDTLRDHNFPLSGTEAADYVGDEQSPFGLLLNIRYPHTDIDILLARAEEAYRQWAKMPLRTRTGIACEIVDRLNAQSFLMALATHHTTGQGGPMAFQAGGPHAQDRAWEAIALCYRELSSIPEDAVWNKGEGKYAVHLEKRYHLKPRGIGLVIGCATFPNWNSYAAIFANLMTGNATLIKPHPQAILPLALTVKIMQDTLAEFGFSPYLVQLAVEKQGAPLAGILAAHEKIGLVDYTGSSVFGRWLHDNVVDKPVFTEESGLNSIVVESTDSFGPMCRNIAFSLALYSGQMCTTPQNIFIPKNGIETDEGHKSFDDVAEGIAKAIDGLLSDPARAAHVCGALYSADVEQRLIRARKKGRIIRGSAPLDRVPEAKQDENCVAKQTDGQFRPRTATPLLVALDANDSTYLAEWFGPISFLIACENANDCVTRATLSAMSFGAITGALYSNDDTFIESAIEDYVDAGLALSINLVGNIWVNQSAAFSDYHVSGANRAGNATLTNTAYIASRFHIICMRRPFKG